MASGLNPLSPLARLLNAPMRPGVVRWLGIRPARHMPLLVVDAAMLDPADGLAGDHYSSGTGTRHVSLITDTDLAAIGQCMGWDTATAESLRRNVVVSGLNLHALRGRQFWLGTAMLEATGLCHPCSRMELSLGTGGYNAVRGHGGITARVLMPGVVRLGDPVRRVDQPSAVNGMLPASAHGPSR